MTRHANWESVIGLEIHVQLATRSKIFSGASTAFGAPPNSQACAVDLGMPGVLPVLNEEAVRMAVTFGVAIGAHLPEQSVFDRKNYFYPDLPKGYQISQFEHPIVGTGHIELHLPDGTVKRVGITRAHLEEDAGKSLHEDFAGMTGVDLNRAGTPLLEIVSEPDMRSAAEAAAYFRHMHELVRYLDICDGNLNEGSMRCDANVSVRRSPSDPLGVRTEIKNINSFRFVERAIEHEIARQIDVIESGGTIRRETRLYDSDRNETRPMRGKELSDDYRYFPEPDLLPVALDAAYIASIRGQLPELPHAKRLRFENEFELSASDAALLTADPEVARFFEATAAACKDPKLAANWVMGEWSAALNRDACEPKDNPMVPTQLGRLISRIKDGTISGKIAKSLFDSLWRDPTADVDTLISSQGVAQVSDADELGALVRKLVEDSPDQVQQYRNGEKKVLGFLVGALMKATAGKANPKTLNELLRRALDND